MNRLSSMMLVLGTTNTGKQQELTALLEPFCIECRSLKDFASAVHVAETGSTFTENAALKAVQQAQALNHWVLAEDSGLVVEALMDRLAFIQPVLQDQRQVMMTTMLCLLNNLPMYRLLAVLHIMHVTRH